MNKPLLAGLCTALALCLALALVHGQPVPVDPAASQALPASSQAPTAEQLQQQIAALEDASDLPEAERNKALDLYRSALKHLQGAETYTQNSTTYQQVIASAPAEMTRLEQALADTSANERVDLPPNASLKTLESQLATTQAQLTALQSKLADINKQRAAQRTRPDTARAELAEARIKMGDVEQALRAPDSTTEPAALTEARRASQRVERLALDNQITMLEQELLSYEPRLALLGAERELLRRQVAAQEAQVAALRKATNAQRRREATQALIVTEWATQQATSKPAVVRETAEENQALSGQLAELSVQIEKTTQARTRFEKQLKELEEHYQSARQQLEIAGLSDALGPVLRSERRRLPDVSQYRRGTEERQKRIEEARLKRFQINEQRRKAGTTEETLERFLANKVDPRTTTQRRDAIATELRPLLADRQQILEQLRNSYASYVTQLTALDQAQKRLIELAQQYAGLLDEKLLWIASGMPVNLTWLGELRDALHQLRALEPWLETLATLRQRVAATPLLTAFVLLSWLSLLWLRRWLRAALAAMSERVGKVERDRFRLTLKAVLYTLLLALPWPLLLGYGGWLLAEQANVSVLAKLFLGGHALERALTAQEASQFASAVGIGLYNVAALTLFLATLIQICRKQGLAQVHFRWNEQTCRLVRINLRWLLALICLPEFLVTLTDWLAEPVYGDTVGRLAFVIAALAMAVFLHRLLHPNKGAPTGLPAAYRDSVWWKLRYLWYALAVGAPLLLTGLALLGYYYTALQLGDLTFISIRLLVGVLIGSNLIVRWLNVEKRRLALARARAKRDAMHAARASREAAEATGSGVPEALETETIDLETISDQTRDLLRLFANITALVGLWLIWNALLPALTALNDVTLWQYTIGEQLQAITLGNLVAAILLTALTLFVARNLPGVLEISVLQRLAMSAGSRYAVTTISRYAITAIGFVVALQLLGFRWEQAQWLVAALSVGLGFGLQEIFANFVSGLIILVERPIRIGDTVTVGDLSGTVTRIRIRATTITDWDRKELIVPNKTFITSSLINWSLSDPITRVIIPVGVAYGSDTARVQKVILETVEANPMVLKEPPPAALFLQFGDSSLNFEVRAFAKDLADRIPLIHELHMSIDRALRQHGIEIPFPQRDLHLKSLPLAWSQGAEPARERALQALQGFGEQKSGSD